MCENSVEQQCTEIDVVLEIDRFYSKSEDLDGIYFLGYGVNKSAIQTPTINYMPMSVTMRNKSHVKCRR